ncbi:glucose 1-dehydrogenase [soil metagenome]
MDRLRDRVILVTGAAQGMGLATAIRCSDEGAHVIACDIAPGAASERITPVLLDVADEQSWATAIAQVTEDHGRLDGLVNNAGVIGYSAILDTTLEEWNRVLSVDLTGVFLGMRASLPLMIASGGGSIVNFSSIWGLAAVSSAHAYHAAKGAIGNMTKNVAVTHATDGIRANSLHPGHILTPLTERQDQATSDIVIGKTAMKRPGRAEEIAATVAFLLSDDSSYMTGTEVVVDGGYLAQ